MQTTTNYGYKVVEGTDSPVNIQNDVAPNFTDIDSDLKAVSDAAITAATHVLSGTVHALVRADADRSVMIFTASGDMTTGDTFTVDGVSVTARLVNGEALQTGSFKINNTVLAILVGTVLNVYAVSEKATAADVSYSNAISGLTATNVQNAIDEVNANVASLEADDIAYDNALSGLSATDVQDAVDEVNSKITNVVTLTTTNEAFTITPGRNFITPTLPIVSGYNVVGLISGLCNTSTKIISDGVDGASIRVYNFETGSVTVTLTLTWLLIKV